jgi:hypothetical protein
MATPSNHKLRNLTAEQQQTIAEVELARLRGRERLRRRARSYRGRRWVSLVFFAVAALVAFINVEFPYRIAAISILTIVFVLLQVHVTGINQRMDALLELMDRAADDTGEEKDS